MSDEQSPPPKEAKRLACPRCGCRHLPVYSTKHYVGKFIRRVRICRNCGKRISTTERLIGG